MELDKQAAVFCWYVQDIVLCSHKRKHSWLKNQIIFRCENPPGVPTEGSAMKHKASPSSILISLPALLRCHRKLNEWKQICVLLLGWRKKAFRYPWGSYLFMRPHGYLQHSSPPWEVITEGVMCVDMRWTHCSLPAVNTSSHSSHAWTQHTIRRGIKAVITIQIMQSQSRAK